MSQKEKQREPMELKRYKRHINQSITMYRPNFDLDSKDIF